MTTTPDSTPAEQSKRTRRAEPINVHTAKNGVVSYWFQIDVGTKPDGTRDRRKFSYPPKAEARKALRRIATEVSSGTYSKPTAITVNEACDDWLAGRRGIRRVTLYSYENDLKPVRRFLGGKRLQQLTKADGDNLVEWMLTEGRTSPRHYRPDSLAGQVAAMVAEHPDGIKAAELAAAFPAGDVHSCLAALLAAGRVTRLRRGVYALAEPSIDADADRTGPGGLPADRALGVDHLLGGRAVLRQSGCIAAQRHCVGRTAEGCRPRRHPGRSRPARTATPTARTSRGRSPRSSGSATPCATTASLPAGFSPATGCAGGGARPAMECDRPRRRCAVGPARPGRGRHRNG